MEEEIIKLRRLTGLGISECRRAHEKFGNIEEAYKYLCDKWRGVWKTADKYINNYGTVHRQSRCSSGDREMKKV